MFECVGVYRKETITYIVKLAKFIFIKGHRYGCTILDNVLHVMVNDNASKLPLKGLCLKPPVQNHFFYSSHSRYPFTF